MGYVVIGRVQSVLKEKTYQSGRIMVWYEVGSSHISKRNMYILSATHFCK